MNSEDSELSVGETVFLGTCGYPGVAIGILDPYLGKRGKNAGGGHEEGYGGDFDADVEWGRTQKAFEASAGELKEKAARLDDVSGNAEGGGARQILESHIMILEDPDFQERIRAKIDNKGMGCMAAVDDAVDEIIAIFQSQESPVFREKAHDMNDIRWSLHYHLESMKNRSDLSGHIVWAASLTPHQVFELKDKRVAAIAIKNSSASSHDLILAAALQIPTIYNIELPPRYMDGKTAVILDSHEGRLIVGAKEETLARYRKKSSGVSEISMGVANRKLREELEAVPDIVATACGEAVDLFANLEFADELQVLPKEKIGGIGLCRTEFLFHDIFSCGEEKQRQIYSSIARYFSGQPVVFRLFDVTPEKTPLLRTTPEGLCSIRYLLANKELLKTQIRALLGSMREAHSDVRILLPMVTLWEELEETAAIVEELARQEGTPQPKLGVMIETPAAVDLMETMNEVVDFYSVGTNDLLQFLTVSKRSMQSHGHIYDPLHESLFKSLERIVDHGGAGAKSVTICGEIAGNPLYLPLLLALGFRSFSVSPHKLLESARTLRETRLEKARGGLAKLRSEKTIAGRRHILNEMGSLNQSSDPS